MLLMGTTLFLFMALLTLSSISGGLRLWMSSGEGKKEMGANAGASARSRDFTTVPCIFDIRNQELVLHRLYGHLKK
jgi:hypothetical protein